MRRTAEDLSNAGRCVRPESGAADAGEVLELGGREACVELLAVEGLPRWPNVLPRIVGVPVRVDEGGRHVLLLMSLARAAASTAAAAATATSAPDSMARLAAGPTACMLARHGKCVKRRGRQVSAGQRRLPLLVLLPAGDGEPWREEQAVCGKAERHRARILAQHPGVVAFQARRKVR